MNDDVLKRLEELEKFIFGHQPYEKNLANRVIDLEETIREIDTNLNFVVTFDYINKELIPRIEKLEKQISNWEEEFYFIQGKIRSTDKKPHKCPVCYGIGKRENIFLLEQKENPDRFIDCNACEGKGIVWG